MRGHYREPKDGSPSLCIQGESVSNCLSTFVLGKWRRLSDRLVSNFIVRQMSFLFGAAVIIGLTLRCSSALKPAVSPFNTLTLHVRSRLPSPHMTPAVSSLCGEGDERDGARREEEGGTHALIAEDIVDLQEEENTSQEKLTACER